MSKLKIILLYSILIVVIMFIAIKYSAISSLPSKAPDVRTPTTTVTSTLPIVNNESELLKDKAWEVFQKYLEAAKNHDLATLKTLAYQISSTCRDNLKIKECNNLMDNAYSFGSQFVKKDMSRIVFDSRQIILASEYNENLYGEAPSITRGIVYFVRQEDTIKFLSLSPFQGAFIIRGDTSTSTISARLKEMIIDSDNDTLSDEIEKCLDTTAVLGCIKTNPYKKDTDNDGFWDSTQSLFYQ